MFNFNYLNLKSCVFEDKLGEDGVCPGEPCSAELFGLVHVNGFMHEECTCVRIYEHVKDIWETKFKPIYESVQEMPKEATAEEGTEENK